MDGFHRPITDMFGVLALFFFRDLPIGGVVSRSLPPDHPNSRQAAAARNKARVPKQWVGVGLIALGWVAQVIASPDVPLRWPLLD